jgi:hypothetical protein
MLADAIYANRNAGEFILGQLFVGAFAVLAEEQGIAAMKSGHAAVTQSPPPQE